MPNIRAEEYQRQLLQRRSAQLLKRATVVPTEVNDNVRFCNSTARKSTHTNRTSSANFSSSITQQHIKEIAKTSTPRRTYQRSGLYSKKNRKIVNGNDAVVRKRKSNKINNTNNNNNNTNNPSVVNSPAATLAIKETLNEMKFKLGMVLKTKKNSLDDSQDTPESPNNFSANTLGVKPKPKRGRRKAPLKDPSPVIEEKSPEITQTELTCENNEFIDNEIETKSVETEDKSVETEEKTVIEPEIMRDNSLDTLFTSSSADVSERAPTEDAGSEEGLKLWLDETSGDSSVSSSTAECANKSDSCVDTEPTADVISTTNKIYSPAKNTLSDKSDDNTQEIITCVSSHVVSTSDNDDDPDREKESEIISTLNLSMENIIDKSPVVMLEPLPSLIMEQLSTAGCVQIIQLTSGNKELDFFTVSNHLHPCRQTRLTKITEPPKVNKVPEISIIDGIEFYSFETEDALIAYTIEDQKQKLASGSAVIGSDVSDSDLYNYVQPIIPTKTNDITKIKGWRNKIFASETTQVKEVFDPEEMRKIHWTKRIQMCKHLSRNERKNAGLLELVKRKRVRVRASKFTKRKIRKQNKFWGSDNAMDLQNEEYVSADNIPLDTEEDLSTNSTDSLASIFNEDSRSDDDSDTRELDEIESDVQEDINEEINEEEEEDPEEEEMEESEGEDDDDEEGGEDGDEEKEDDDEVDENDHVPTPNLTPRVQMVKRDRRDRSKPKRSYIRRKITTKMKIKGPFKTHFGWFQKFGTVCVPVGSVTDPVPTFSPGTPLYQYSVADKAKLKRREDNTGLEFSTSSLADKGIISPRLAEFAVSALKDIKCMEPKPSVIFMDNAINPVKTVIKIDETNTNAPMITAVTDLSTPREVLNTMPRLELVDDGVAKDQVSDFETPQCGHGFCRYGCLCDSLRVRKRKRTHCGKVDCMFMCDCGFTISAKGDNGPRVLNCPVENIETRENILTDDGPVKRRRISRPPARLMDCEFPCRSKKDLNAMPELMREKLEHDMMIRRSLKPFRSARTAVKRTAPKYIPPFTSTHSSVPLLPGEPKVPPIRITNLKGNTFPKILRPILPKPRAVDSAAIDQNYRFFQKIDRPVKTAGTESHHVLPCGTTVVDGKVIVNIPKETNARALLTMGEITKGKSSLRFIGLKTTKSNTNALQGVCRNSASDGSFQMTNTSNWMKGQYAATNGSLSAYSGPTDMTVSNQKRTEKIIGYIISKQNLKDAVSLAKITKSPVSAPVTLAAADFVRFVPRSATAEAMNAPQFNIYPIEKSNTHVFVGPFDKILPKEYKEYIRSLVIEEPSRPQNVATVQTDVETVVNSLVDRVCEVAASGKSAQPMVCKTSSAPFPTNPNNNFTRLTISGRKIISKRMVASSDVDHRPKKSKSYEDDFNIFEKFGSVGSVRVMKKRQAAASPKPQLLSAEVAPLAWKKSVELHRETERNRRQELKKCMRKLTATLHSCSENSFNWKSKHPTKSVLLHETKRCISNLQEAGKLMESTKRALVNKRKKLFFQYTRLLKEFPPDVQKRAIDSLASRLKECSQARLAQNVNLTNGDNDLNGNVRRQLVPKFNECSSSSTTTGSSTPSSSSSDLSSTTTSESDSNDISDKRNSDKASLMAIQSSLIPNIESKITNVVTNPVINCGEYLETVEDGTDLYMYAEVEEEQERNMQIGIGSGLHDERKRLNLDGTNSTTPVINSCDIKTQSESERVSVEKQSPRPLTNHAPKKVIELTADSLKSLQKSLGLDKTKDDIIEECFEAVILPSEETLSATEEHVVELPKIIACETITEAEFLADS